MSYDVREKSVHDAAPVECYKFVGDFKTYLYTSSPVAITLDGLVFLPLQIKRAEARTGTQEDDQLSLDIEVPFDCDVMLDYAYAVAPPTLVATVYRGHLGDDLSVDWAIYWKGHVTGFSMSGRQGKLIIPSIFSLALAGNAPSVYYQTQCGHTLYDALCKVDPTAHKYTTSCRTIAPGPDFSLAEFDVPSFPTAFDDVYKGGFAVNNRTGEKRLVVTNKQIVYTDPNGHMTTYNVITLGSVFSSLNVGDSIDMFEGCDHAETTCINKFNNKVNYGGSLLIPPDNPFIGAIH